MKYWFIYYYFHVYVEGVRRLKRKILADGRGHTTYFSDKPFFQIADVEKKLEEDVVQAKFGPFAKKAKVVIVIANFIEITKETCDEYHREKTN